MALQGYPKSLPASYSISGINIPTCVDIARQQDYWHFKSEIFADPAWKNLPVWSFFVKLNMTTPIGFLWEARSGSYRFRCDGRDKLSVERVALKPSGSWLACNWQKPLFKWHPLCKHCIWAIFQMKIQYMWNIPPCVSGHIKVPTKKSCWCYLGLLGAQQCPSY